MKIKNDEEVKQLIQKKIWYNAKTFFLKVNFNHKNLLLFFHRICFYYLIFCIIYH
jgi:hypothetical protein